MVPKGLTWSPRHGMVPKILKWSLRAWNVLQEPWVVLKNWDGHQKPGAVPRIPGWYPRREVPMDGPQELGTVAKTWVGPQGLG